MGYDIRAGQSGTRHLSKLFIRDLEDDVVTRRGELRFIVQVLKSLIAHAAAVRTPSSLAESWAGGTLDKMSELYSVIEGLARTFSGEHLQVANL